jgi:hypothetical protein
MQRAVSSIVLVIGPTCDNVPNALGGECAMHANVGLIVDKLQNVDGILTDPPASVPIEIGPKPKGTAAPAPPDDPPLVNDRSYGFLVIPVRGEIVTPHHPWSGVVVFPTKIALCSSNRATQGDAYVPIGAGSKLEPKYVGHPGTNKISFILFMVRIVTVLTYVTGTPSSKPF